MTTVEGLFEHFKELTGGDVSAAASLVLAHATLETKDTTRPSDGWMSCNSVAEKLGVSPKTIRELIKSGDLHATRIGQGRGTYRVSPADLLAFQKNGGSLPDDKQYKHL